jgi:hypothetical protein
MMEDLPLRPSRYRDRRSTRHDARDGRRKAVGAEGPIGPVFSKPTGEQLSNTNMLVPETILASHEGELGQLLAGSEFSPAVDPHDEYYGFALRRALLFARWPFLLNDWHQLSEQDILYNYYYWQSIFSKLYMSKHGFDPELEETSIQILGTAKVAIDWALIEKIDHLVECEVAEWIGHHP